MMSNTKASPRAPREDKGKELPDHYCKCGREDCPINKRLDSSPSKSVDEEKEYCDICGRLIGKRGKIYIAGSICPGHYVEAQSPASSELDELVEDFFDRARNTCLDCEHPICLRHKKSAKQQIQDLIAAETTKANKALLFSLKVEIAKITLHQHA